MLKRSLGTAFFSLKFATVPLWVGSTLMEMETCLILNVRIIEHQKQFSHVFQTTHIWFSTKCHYSSPLPLHLSLSLLIIIVWVITFLKAQCKAHLDSSTFPAYSILGICPIQSSQMQWIPLCENAGLRLKRVAWVGLVSPVVVLFVCWLSFRLFHRHISCPKGFQPCGRCKWTAMRGKRCGKGKEWTKQSYKHGIQKKCLKGLVNLQKNQIFQSCKMSQICSLWPHDCVLFSFFLPRGCSPHSLSRMGDIHLMIFLCQGAVTCKNKCFNEVGFSWGGKNAIFVFWSLFEQQINEINSTGNTYMALDISKLLMLRKWNCSVVMPFFSPKCQPLWVCHGMGDNNGDYFTNPCIFLVTCASLLLEKHSEITSNINSYDQLW